MARLRIRKVKENDYRIEERWFGCFWRDMYAARHYKLEYAYESVDSWGNMFYTKGPIAVKFWKFWHRKGTIAVFKGEEILMDFRTLTRF